MKITLPFPFCGLEILAVSCLGLFGGYFAIWMHCASFDILPVGLAPLLWVISLGLWMFS